VSEKTWRDTSRASWTDTSAGYFKKQQRSRWRNWFVSSV